MKKETEKRFEKIEKRVGKIEGTLFKDGLARGGVLVRCYFGNCKKTWVTRSKSKSTSCPCCGNKVNIEKGIENARK